MNFSSAPVDQAAINETQNITTAVSYTVVGAEKLLDGEATTAVQLHSIWNSQHVPFFILFASLASIFVVLALFAAKKLCAIKDDDPEKGIKKEDEETASALPRKQDLDNAGKQDEQNDENDQGLKPLEDKKNPERRDQEIQYELPSDFAPQPPFTKPQDEISQVTRSTATSEYRLEVLERFKMALVKTTSTSGICGQSTMSTSTTSLHQQEEDDYESLSINQTEKNYNKPVLLNRQQVAHHLNSILLSISSDRARIETNKSRRKQSITTGTTTQVREDQQLTDKDISEIQDSASSLEPQLDLPATTSSPAIHGFRKYDSWPFDPPEEVEQELSNITDELHSEHAMVNAASQTNLKRKKRHRSSQRLKSDIDQFLDQDKIDEESEPTEFPGDILFDDMMVGGLLDLERDILELPPERPHDLFNGGGIPSYNLHRHGDKRYGSRKSIYKLKTSSHSRRKPRREE